MAKAADFWNTLDRYDSFLITSHVRPDPDALGSELALAIFLRKLAKTCYIVNDSPLPASCAFLPQSDMVLTYPAGMDANYQAVICLDVPDISRTGAVGAAIADVPLLVVDHHPYNSHTPDFSWIDPSVSSTGELIYTFVSYQRELVDSDIATCLYAAILTDTGRFTYANTSHKTLQAAADLVSLGADPSYIAESYYQNVTDAQMHIFGLAASRMRRAADGVVAYTSLSDEDFERAGVGPEVAQELAELPRSLSGVRIGVLLRDIGGKVKVSLRSKSGTDVKTIAEHFGGGGHHEASGFLLELPLAQAEIEVIRFLEENLK